MLKKRKLGNSGVEVYPIGVGLWAIGGSTWGTTNDKESLETIERALDLGIDFFDTADMYGNGHSETLLAKAMKGRRERFIVGTKLGWWNFDRDNSHSQYTSVDKLIRGVQSNLKRLGTDYVDFLQWHVNFREKTMEIFIEGSERLKEQGKIRGYGVSTSDFLYLQDFTDAGRPDTLQIDYSILNRTPEEQIFPFCMEKNIGTIIRGGLAMGILSGKFSRSSTFEPGDFRTAWTDDPDQRDQFHKDLDVVDKLREAFPETDLAQLAIRFILTNPAVSVVIPGAKRVSQLESNFNAGEHGVLTREEARRIDRIVPPSGGRKIWPA